ncbi:PAS domain S-box-containing protein/HDIG domain-containing protein [Caloranaerobacter azorensis DSM 13643]|uniref:PAS domain S-box-containing protein/HDIG domain-containing protein n=1 Tax=Caloranaerobacter azorensis DSM 13643 TaxID=1121264 RepID=A0A1M5WMU4_9FIRM|nr:HD domain-containing phosphohydrolase [Caloranaerobacter azorensis]SHH88841.1 PAS domain S-box-containing protein/HDIG domain-containing protein [Caloranaerobacter azorensis DSM 13643]
MILDSFKRKLIITLVILAIIPIITLRMAIDFTVKEQIINQAISIEKQFIDNKADEINRWFSDKEQILETVVNNYLVHKEEKESEVDFEKVNYYLTNLAEKTNFFSDIYIIVKDMTKNNFVLLDDEIDVRLKPLYYKVLKTGNTLWSQPYKDLKTGKTILTVFMPVKDETGKIEEIIGADVFVNSIEDILGNLENKLVSGGFNIIITTLEGKKLDFFYENKNIINNFNKELKNVNLIELINENNREISIRDKEYFIIKSIIPKVRWKLICLIDKSVFQKSIIEIINKYVIVTIVFTLIFVILLASFLSAQFSKPLEELKKGAIELYKGNYNYRIPMYRNDEFGQLAKAFNRTIEELDKSYKRLNEQTKMLIENNKQLQGMNVELEASYEQLQYMALELNDSEEKYKLLVENMNDLVCVVDPNYKIIFVNDQVKYMLKYDKEEVVGKDVRNFLSKIWYFDSKNGKSDDLNNNFEKLLKSDYDSIQVVLISKNGKEVIGEVSTRRIFDNEKLISVYVVLRDITERKKLYSQIIRKNEELSTINKISKNLNSTMDLDKLLKMVVDDIVDLMKIPLCTIRLLTDDNKLKLMAYSGELTDIIWFDDIPVDDDILGKAVIEGKTIIINKFTEENISKYNEKIVKSGKVNCANTIPLIAREKTLGVLAVTTKQEINESQTAILTSVANQVAMIIENINLYNGLKESYLRTIKTLAAAVEAKDKYTEGHSYRVSKYSYLIAKHMGLSDKVCEEVEIGGILHDIGKIGIRDSILTKPGKLTDEEFNEIKRHPTIGDRILQNVGFSNIVMNVIKYHHKRYDLKGYPEESKLEELPLEACIVGVADALDAMASNRSYRRAMSIEEAIKEIIKNKGTQFHPKVVDSLVDIYNKNPKIIIEISKSYCD